MNDDATVNRDSFPSPGAEFVCSRFLIFITRSTYHIRYTTSVIGFG